MVGDYGRIDEFRNRDYPGKTGFGFVNRTFHPARDRRDKIYFHIKQIKQKYPELAAKLDAGDWHGLTLWYTIEETERGKQIEDFWLKAKEIPNSTALEFRRMIESGWNNGGPKNDMFIRAARDLLGGAEFDRLKAKREKKKTGQEKLLSPKARMFGGEQQACGDNDQRGSENLRGRIVLFYPSVKSHHEIEKKEIEARKKVVERIEPAIQPKEPAIPKIEEPKTVPARVRQIQQFVREQQISDLVHFTHLSNLENISRHGLISRAELEQLPQESRPYFPDDERIDGQRNAICLSVSFPNYRMFYRYRLQEPEGWVVIVLKPEILWELNCAFCLENAASNNVRFVPITERKQFSAFESMFTDYSEIEREKLNIPINYPTHPQAEVLAFDPIPVSYFKAVQFPSFKSLEKWKAIQENHSMISFVYNVQYFQPRSDWPHWKNKTNTTYS